MFGLFLAVLLGGFEFRCESYSSVSNDVLTVDSTELAEAKRCGAARLVVAKGTYRFLSDAPIALSGLSGLSAARHEARHALAL